jgi:hypothetical protein
MNMAELFPEGGRGIIGTADDKGVVNLAIFAVPHVVDEKTLAWGFSDGRSSQNLALNPHASYLYLAPTRGYSGWRLTLTVKQQEGGADLLETIRQEAAQSAGPQAAEVITKLFFFNVDEVRPLM